jgi:hypothetical protein
VLLSGCTGGIANRAINQATPIVYADSGGSAELEVKACPAPENAMITQRSINQLLLTLQVAGVLVAAQEGNAKLIIDLCAGG